MSLLVKRKCSVYIVHTLVSFLLWLFFSYICNIYKWIRKKFSFSMLLEMFLCVNNLSNVLNITFPWRAVYWQSRNYTFIFLKINFFKTGDICIGELFQILSFEYTVSHNFRKTKSEIFNCQNILNHFFSALTSHITNIFH